MECCKELKEDMKKIMIAGILVVVIIVSVGLVTAGFGFNSSDRTVENDNVCAGNECGTCDGSCDGDGQCTGECKGTCKQNGECTEICDGQGTGKQCTNQNNNENCLTRSNSCGGCRRN